jgi:hypothetical protein
MSSVFIPELWQQDEFSGKVTEPKFSAPDGVCKYHTVDPNDKLSCVHVFQGKNGKNGYSKQSCSAARAAWQINWWNSKRKT